MKIKEMTMKRIIFLFLIFTLPLFAQVERAPLWESLSAGVMTPRTQYNLNPFGNQLGNLGATGTRWNLAWFDTTTTNHLSNTTWTLNSVGVTTTGTQLNYLASATGTTGTTNTNLVFSTSPVLVTPTLGIFTATSGKIVDSLKFDMLDVYGDFNFLTDTATNVSGTRRNTTLKWGYNMRPWGGRQVASEPTLGYGIESYWINSVDSSTQTTEAYLLYAEKNTGTHHYVWMHQVNRNTHDVTGFDNSRLFTFKDDLTVDSNFIARTIRSNGNVSIYANGTRGYYINDAAGNPGYNFTHQNDGALHIANSNIENLILDSSGALTIGTVAGNATGTPGSFFAGSGKFNGSITPILSAGTANFSFDGYQGDYIQADSAVVVNPFGNAVNFSGLFVINNYNGDGSCAIFLTGGGIMTLVSQTATLFSTTADTPNRYNVYLSGTVVKLQNLAVASTRFRIMSFRMRDAQ